MNLFFVMTSLERKSERERESGREYRGSSTKVCTLTRRKYNKNPSTEAIRKGCKAFICDNKHVPFTFTKKKMIFLNARFIILTKKISNVFCSLINNIRYILLLFFFYRYHVWGKVTET